MNESELLEQVDYATRCVESLISKVKTARGMAMDLVDDYETRGEDCAEQYWFAAAMYGRLHEAFRKLQDADFELEKIREEARGKLWV
jgi:hypothetical protein